MRLWENGGGFRTGEVMGSEGMTLMAELAHEHSSEVMSMRKTQTSISP